MYLFYEVCCMKWLQTKKALYYLCALIVLIGYQILCAVLYNQRGAEYLQDESHYFLYLFYSILRWGVSGVLAGFFLHLIPERKRSGTWQFNWPRFIFFSGGLILLIVFEQIHHITTVFDFFFRPVHYYLFGDASVQVLLIFLLCFSLTTCFYKKTLPEPAEALSRMKFAKIKNSVYYLLTLTVLLGYLSLWTGFCQSDEYQTWFMNSKISFVLFYLVYPLLIFCISGLMAGFFIHLIPEMKRSGTWRFNWPRFIFFIVGLILIIASDQIYYYVNFLIPFHQLLFYRFSIQWYMFFLLGYSLISCLCKKTRQESAEVEAEEKAQVK